MQLFNISTVTTSQDEGIESTLPWIAIDYSERVFWGIRQSHSHTNGNSVPSRHYGYESCNLATLMPHNEGANKVRVADNVVKT